MHIQCEATEQSIYYDDFFSFFLPPQIQQRVYHTSGSGVIIQENGYIITNNHVVQNAEKIKVILNDKRIFDAILIGNDPACDLAVIKINATNLPAITVAKSDDLKAGQFVVAIGNPGGLEFMGSVTYGVISGLNRIVADSYDSVKLLCGNDELFGEAQTVHTGATRNSASLLACHCGGIKRGAE